MTENPANVEVKALALKTGVSGDYYLASTDTWYAVAVDPAANECFILGWYSGVIKRQSSEAALQCSMDLWKQLIHPELGVSYANYL
jgi:hypothetical protein